MKQKPSLKKQVFGATIGSALAVGLYYTYTLASPLVTAYVLRTEDYPKFLQGETTVISNTQLKGDRKDRLENRVQKSITFENSSSNDLVDEVDSSTHSGAPEPFFPVTNYTVPVETQVTETITTTTTQVVPSQITTREPVVAHAEVLPNSGLATWALVSVAFFGAILLHCKKRLWSFFH